MRYLFLIIISCFSTSLLMAGPVSLNETHTKVNLGPYLEFLEDASGAVSMQKLLDNEELYKDKWQKTHKENLHFGYTNSVYWVRFSVKNDSAHSLDWILQLDYPLLDYITLFTLHNDGTYDTYESGDRLNFSQRQFEHRTFVFPKTTAANSGSTYYFRFQSQGTMNIPLKIWSPRAFEEYRKYESPLLWLYLGFLLTVLVYNCCIYILIRDVNFLYYIVYILAFVILVMSLNGLSFQYLWPGSPWWANNSLPLITSLTLTACIVFVRRFLVIRKASKLVDKILLGILGLSLVVGSISLVTAKYHIGIISMVLLCALFIFFSFPYITYLAFVKNNRQAKFFVFAFLLFLLGAFVYILFAFALVPDIFITAYGFQLGAACQVVLLSLGLAEGINMMKQELEKTEKKYRHLVENSGDIIFSLDADLNFLTTNRAMKRHLGYKEREVLGNSFFDFVYNIGDEKNSIFRRMVMDYIRDLRADNDSISLKTTFRTKYTREPKDMSVKLEYTEYEGTVEILGKASVVTEDIIGQFLDTEKFTYSINNYLSNTEFLSHRLTRNLNKFMEPSRVSLIRIAIREVLVNSIEHGNLNLHFEEKTKAMLDGTYLEIINARQKDPRYHDRLVSIEYTLNNDRVAYRISDEGNGFDHEVIMDMTADDVNADLTPHGRGLLVAKKQFDVIRFSDRGNQVLLVKYFNRAPRTEPTFIVDDSICYDPD
ncbi:MAG: PAS domain S-box protein [bacterium]|nr:PAS domain S-box protein [bacterium]